MPLFVDIQQTLQTTFKKQFLLLGLAYFLFFIGFNAIIPELPEYLRSLGGDKYLGYIISLFAFSAMLTRPLSGKLTDNIGRRPIMLLGSVVGVLVLSLYPLFPFVIGFLMLRFAHGFSAGFMPAAAATSVADIVPDNKMGKYMGYLGIFSSTGMALGPVFGSWIAMQWGINTVFYVAASITAISLLSILFIKESLESPKPFHHNMLKLNRQDIFDLKVKHPAVVMMLSVFSFGAILTLIPDLSDSLGIQNRGTFFFLFTLSSLFIRLVFSNSIDNFDKAFLLKIGCAVFAVCMFLLAFVQNKIQFQIIALFLGLAGGVNSPVLFSWTIELADSQNRSRALSTLFIALEIGILSGAWLSGYIFDIELKNFFAPFAIAGLLSLISFIYLFSVKSKT